MGRADFTASLDAKTVMKPLLTISFLCTWTGASLLVLDVAVAAEGPLPALRLALLDFEDQAGFQAEWHLSRDVPDLLGRYLDADDAVSVIPAKEVEAVQLNKQFKKYHGIDRAVRLGQSLDADVVITGIVEKLGMRRMTVGNPNLAGYKSYNSVVHLSQVQLIRVATGEIVETLETLRDSTEKSYGLDLFGRPREQDRVFRELFKVDFGSERFFELAFGQLVDIAFRDLSSQMITSLTERPPIDLSGAQAQVLAVEADEVYLGIGILDRVEYGDVLPLYDKEVRIALVRVHQLIGPHLCKAEVVEKFGVIDTGLRIGQRLSRNSKEDN